MGLTMRTRFGLHKGSRDQVQKTLDVSTEP